SHRSDLWQTRQRTVAKLSLAFVHEDVQMASAVDDGSVRIAVCVEIGPGESLYSRDSSERMDGQECAVSIVAEDRWFALRTAEHDVEIAIGFDINCPGAGVSCVGYRLRQLGGWRDIAELCRTLLTHEPHAARSGQNEIGFKIVVEVERSNPVGPGRNVLR